MTATIAVDDFIPLVDRYRRRYRSTDFDGLSNKTIKINSLDCLDARERRALKERS
jgi:hypothetical protein